MFAFYNLGTEPVTIEKGYAIGQGIFQKYLVTEDDNADGKRTGGFGSSRTKRNIDLQKYILLQLKK